MTLSADYPWAKPNRPLTVERLADAVIDVGELHYANLFGDEWKTVRLPFRWLNIARMKISRFVIVLDFVHLSTPQRIRVSWSQCNLGGARPWLHCSHCSRRVAKLYEGCGFFCRACLGNPQYASQRKSAAGRRHFEACKLRQRLGGELSLTAPFPRRPKGMHRRTYTRLKLRYAAIEARLTDRVRAKYPDYPNLVYYLPSEIAC